MNKIIGIVLVIEIVISICIDYILGLLSKTRISQYYYANIRQWLIDIEHLLLLLIIVTLFYILVRWIIRNLK